jgi:DNA mismatch endonuclease (patch repair protein)
MPKTRVEFWQAKFNANVERDERVRSALDAMGWTVLVIWECETRDPARVTTILSQIAAIEPTPKRHGTGGVVASDRVGDRDRHVMMASVAPQQQISGGRDVGQRGGYH